MKKSVSTINQNELERLTTSFEKGDFINLVTITKVRMNKKNNPYFDKVFKTSKKNVRLLPDYEKGNKRQTQILR